MSAPVDLMAAGHALGQGFNLLYARHFLATLNPKALEKLSQHPGLYDAARVRAARTLREFDDVVTAPAARIYRRGRLLDAREQQAMALAYRRADTDDQRTQRPFPAMQRPAVARMKLLQP